MLQIGPVCDKSAIFSGVVFLIFFSSLFPKYFVKKWALGKSALKVHKNPGGAGEEGPNLFLKKPKLKLHFL